MIDNQVLWERHRLRKLNKLDKQYAKETIEEYLARGGRVNEGPCPHPDVIKRWKQELVRSK
jgi:hypothetical protein